MSESILRNTLDIAVEKIVKGMDKKTFIDSFPKEVDKNLLTNYHGRLIEIIKPKLSQSIEETLEENDVIKKLSELDKLIASTTHSQNHQAWRPSSSHGSGGPEQCMIAHDYLVASQEKEELLSILKQLEDENQTLESQLSETTSKVKNNMETIEKRNEELKEMVIRLKNSTQ